MSYNEFEKESGATNNESKLLKTFSVLPIKGIASQMCFDVINKIVINDFILLDDDEEVHLWWSGLDKNI